MTLEEIQLRDDFAGLALQGLLSSCGPHWDIGADKRYLAKECYQYADSMIQARAELVNQERNRAV